MTRHMIVSRLVVALVLSHTTVANTEAKNLPHVNVSTTHSHQKELVGSKRAVASLAGTSVNNKKDASKINKAIAQLVFEETLKSLPNAHKSQANKISRTIIDEANKHQMDPLFLIAVIKHESYFDPEMVGSFKEIGLMQIKPSTAEWLNKKIGLKSIDLRDPVINIKLGTAFFSQLRDKFEKDSKLYIAAYNMGPANVRKLLKQNKKPKEYAGKVMKNYIDLIETLELSLMKAPFQLAKN